MKIYPIQQPTPYLVRLQILLSFSRKNVRGMINSFCVALCRMYFSSPFLRLPFVYTCVLNGFNYEIEKVLK